MSQHVVSFIEVLGLAIGLLGFFYLSLSGGMFGERGPSIIRPILPGLALAVSFSLAYYALPPLGFTGEPHSLSLQSLAVQTLVPFVAGYFFAFFSQQESYVKRQFFTDLGIYSALMFVSGAAANIFQYVNGGDRIPLSVGVLLHALANLIGVILVMNLTVFVGPVLLKERVMKTIGIVATILAILAQFLPPVLDLLNIPITKP